MSTAFGDPGSLAMLERRISEYASQTKQTAGRVRVTMSQVVVSQLLPNSLSKLRRRFTRARSQEATELATWLIYNCCGKPMKHRWS